MWIKPILIKYPYQPVKQSLHFQIINLATQNGLEMELTFLEHKLTFNYVFYAATSAL